MHAGFFEQCAKAGEKVEAGQVLAIISDPYTADVLQEVRAPISGIVAFAHNETLAYQNTAVYKLIPEEDEL
jgi:predicted deacylase